MDVIALTMKNNVLGPSNCSFVLVDLTLIQFDIKLSSYKGPMFFHLELDLTPSLWSCQYFHSMYDRYSSSKQH